MIKIEKKWRDMVYSALSQFAEIPPEEWEKGISKGRLLHLKKDQYFVRAGSVPDKMAFILSGIFRVFYITEDGEEKILVFREEGRLLSAFSAFLENRNSWFYIQALEDSDLIYIGLDDYKKSLSENPCWQTISAKYVEMLFVEKEQREREFLSDDAETRYRHFIEKYPGIEKRIRQYHIASYLGITPVALSRIKNSIK